MAEILSCREVEKSFRPSPLARPVPVLRGVSLALMEGECLGITGPSGCGKTTLLRILLGLLPWDQGQVTFRGRDLSQMKGRDRGEFRRQVQFLPQRPEGAFDPQRTFRYSLEEALTIHAIPGDRETLLTAALNRVRLSTALLDRRPHQVSGGEIQRLALARALLPQPRVLILDEPTSMLDLSVQAGVLHLLKELQREQGLSCLFVTHDHAAAEFLCHRILSLPQLQEKMDR